MKLATLKSRQSRDGQLCLVDIKLKHVLPIPDLAQSLQQALEQWDTLLPKLAERSEALNEGKCSGSLDYASCDFESPLPRAYQWLDASAFVHHVELVRKSRGVDMPADFWTNPLMYQGGSDRFIGPNDPIPVSDEAFGIDFEAEVAVITDDVPMGISAEKAGAHIKLLMLVNDVSLRNLAAPELAKGFGFLQSKPASSFSPIALSPASLGKAWDDGRLHLPLKSYLNDHLFGQPNAGIDMTFSFPELIAHAAKTRALSAGTIIGSGTVSNRNPQVGSSCIVERRMLEILDQGQAITPFMHFGDKIRIDMQDEEGQSLFGAIHQTVVPYKGPA